MDLANENRMDVQARTQQASSNDEEIDNPSNAAIAEQIPGGRYDLVERLSAGAIGAVYKARDIVLDRPVAVKCVRLDTPFADHSPDELRERFVREARIAARLQHSSIVTIHDIVATPDRGFIIMEFIEGQSLESMLASRSRLELSTAVRIISQLASALDYAHERNVVHRDVKPSNILISSSHDVWVTDFGIAKSELATNLTMAGGALGTPDYMSPEQAKGEDVDRRSDLFSLGCILFECAVGEKPFRSPSLTGVLLSIINDEPFFPLNWRSLGLPTALRPILHHALEKDRDKRFPTGSELIAALTSLPPDAVETADALVRNEVPVTEEPKAEEPKAEGPKAEGPKAEGPKAEEPKAEEPKAEEPKAEGPKAEGPKAEEPKAEGPKAEEPKAEEPKAEGPKAEEVTLPGKSGRVDHLASADLRACNCSNSIGLT